MKISRNKIAIYSSIFAIPRLIVSYVTGVQTMVSSLRTAPGSSLPQIFAFAFIIFASVALIANAITHSRFERLFKRQTDKQTTSETVSSAQFKNVDEFYKTYSSRMLNETEDLVKKESDQYQPGTDRERYLIRLAAVLTTLSIFERAWLIIYGSQLKLLQDLNIHGIKSHSEVRSFYEEAVKAHPDYYKSVSFDVWISWLKNWLLVRDYDASHLEITIRGQDFLRYLLEARYDPASRLG